VLPLIDFSRAGEAGCFASRVCALRGLLFHEIKTAFLDKVLLGTTVTNPLPPTVVLNRVLASRSRQQQTGDEMSTLFGQVTAFTLFIFALA
jgi:hypothetical protein